MFIVVPFSDSIRIPASELGNNVEDVLINEIDLKYANRVIAGLGLVISTYALDKVSQSVIYPGDGGAFTTADFRLLVFRPVQDEVLVGRVKSCDRQHGIQLTLDFFDDIYIPPSSMRDSYKFDEATHSWVWHFIPEGSPEDTEPTMLPISEKANVRCLVTSIQYSDEAGLARRLDAAQVAAAAARGAAPVPAAGGPVAAGAIPSVPGTTAGGAAASAGGAGSTALALPAAPEKPKTPAEQLNEVWNKVYADKGAGNGAATAPMPGDRDAFRPSLLCSGAPETDGANLPSWDSMASYSLVPPSGMGPAPRGPLMPVQSSHAAARKALRTELALVNSSEGATRSFGGDVRTGPTAVSPMVVYCSIALDGTGCPEWWPSEEAPPATDEAPPATETA